MCPGMLHLRFHRRGPSNPNSPVLDRSSWDPSSLQAAHLAPVTPDDAIPVPEARPRSAVSLSYSRVDPPVLPPVTRVVSSDSTRSPVGQNSEKESPDDTKPRDGSKASLKSPSAEQSSFIGGLALKNYRREQATINQPAPQRETINAPVDSNSAARSSSISGSKALGSAKPVPSFVSPKDLQNALSAKKKLSSEPSVPPNAPVGREPSKAKKTLPFLKNPIPSLLLRRKTSQNTSTPALPSSNTPEDPTPFQIRGTRVHDFSAPRPWKPIVQPPNVGNEPTTSVASRASPYHAPLAPNSALPVPPKDSHTESSRASSSYSNGPLIDRTLSQKSQSLSGAQSVKIPVEEESKQRERSSTVRSKAPISRNTSAASIKSALSAIPRHMKSTSSRFSFDMIGAAEQEKILEERHRQRQQDKSLGSSGGRRDSRFDEFDEDPYEYDDAIYHDDDLEERIPGVNADSDEEDYDALNDPDNDQENFAGFSFQRSDPTSSLTTPHSTGVAPTPRDPDGHFIGEDQTEETTGSEQCQATPDTLSDTHPSKPDNIGASTGLGIQDLQPVMEYPELAVPQQPAPRSDGRSHLSKDDELYFNDGLIHDFDGEGDGSAFDESIFDLNDTDKYGRPIPGMFANALAQRSMPLDPEKRESDIISRLSAQSVVSQSTAHTSPSGDTRSKMADPEDEAGASHVLQPQASQQTTSHLEDNAVVAYQAALAAAAHKAAASGKFRRDSSPDPPTDPAITSSTTLESSLPEPDAIDDDPLAGYEDDDGFSTGLDDYELDDDYITAEANASVLANDFDGWYGQEFGFYPAPAPQSSHVHSLLSEKNLYQYSNGGYFGPSGVHRSVSGRLVSREPNLTPITERSEYSNRNSLMSNGWPQGPSGNNTIQSPGLTQLAMMAEDQDISLAGLLRLRNKAWGGSQASLTSSREGSPYDRNDANNPLGQELGGMSIAPGRNSAFSIYSQDSAGPGSNPESPTLVMAVSNMATNSIPPLAMSSSLTTSLVTAPIFSHLSGSATFPPVSEVEEPSSPEAAEQPAYNLNERTVSAVSISSKPRSDVGHRHNRSSGSISYVKEDDSGEIRWILERRRTGESGEVELLEREVVGGGTI